MQSIREGMFANGTPGNYGLMHRLQRPHYCGTYKTQGFGAGKPFGLMPGSRKQALQESETDLEYFRRCGRITYTQLRKLRKFARLHGESVAYA